jgi:hypothetical protein
MLPYTFKSSPWLQTYNIVSFIKVLFSTLYWSVFLGTLELEEKGLRPFSLFYFRKIITLRVYLQGHEWH